MLTTSNSPNIFQSLHNRESGRAKGFEINYVHESLVRNIKGNKCSQKIINHKEGNLTTFLIQDQYAATLSSKTLKLWDMATKKKLWKYTLDPHLIWKEIIKIIDGKIVCTSASTIINAQNFEKTINIIDLQTGRQTAAITNSKLRDGRTCIVGKSIFSVFHNAAIGEWDLEGREIQIHNLGKTTYNHTDLLVMNRSLDNSKILASDFFLVHFDNSDLSIRNLQKKVNKFAEWKYDSQIHSQPAKVIDGKFLIFGFDKRQRGGYDKYRISDPECCIYDLESMQITENYHKEDKEFISLGTEEDHQNYLLENGSVQKIVVNEDWIFLGFNNGRLVAINFAEKKHKVLGKHSLAIHDLAIDGNILISGSKEFEGQQQIAAEVKLWDLKSLEKIAETRLPSLAKISFMSGKVLVASGNQLCEWDFFLPPSIQKDFNYDDPGVWSLSQ